VTSSQRVYVFNPSQKISIHLNSISGSTQHIHASFFEDKILKPGENTSFEAVFLPRHAGNVESTLFIDTSEGRFSYQLFGVGLESEFRIKSILCSHVSLNSSCSPLITLHNPTEQPIRVKEIYSSSVNLHLQLPNGQDSAPKSSWVSSSFFTSFYHVINARRKLNPSRRKH